MHTFKLTAVLRLLPFFFFFIPYEAIGESQSSPFEGLFSFFWKETNYMFGWYKANGSLRAVPE